MLQYNQIFRGYIFPHKALKVKMSKWSVIHFLFFFKRERVQVMGGFEVWWAR